MSIDADLNMGLIDQNEAKRRRKDIEKEAAFYGAMDGAMAVGTPKSADERNHRLEALGIAGSDIAVLIAAAKVLVRLG